MLISEYRQRLRLLAGLRAACSSRALPFRSISPAHPRDWKISIQDLLKHQAIELVEKLTTVPVMALA